MEPAQYVNILRRRWWVLLLGTALAVAASLYVSLTTTPTYRTTTRLLLNQALIPGLDRETLTSERLAKTYGEVLQSWPLLEDTARQLGLPYGAGELGERVSVRAVPNTQILELAVEDTDPARAAAIANRLAESFIARNRELQAGSSQAASRQVDQELADLRARIDDIARRLGQLRATPGGGDAAAGEIARLQGELTQYQDNYFRLLQTQQSIALAQAQATSSISVIAPARVPTAPVRPNTTLTAILAAIVGLVVALGLVLLVEYFDDRVRDPRALQERYGVAPLSTLGYIGRGTDRTVADATVRSSGHFDEALRLLRTNLDFIVRVEPAVIVVTSAEAGEGKSTVAANLAIAQAQAGKRVVLIDADLRKPSLHRFFDLGNTQGLSTFLARRQASQALPEQGGPLGIRVVTSGPIPPNPSELLGSQAMAELLTALRAQADVIVIDSVPILPVADTLVLQRHADGVLLVMDVSRTGAKTLERALQSLRQVSAVILGVVLNKDRSRNGSTYYGYEHRGAAPAGGARRADPAR